MNFSIALPSRNQPKALKRCIDSIFDLAKNPDKIEIFLSIDDDDCNLYSEIIKKYINKKNIKLLIRPQNPHLVNYYFNEPLKQSKGKIITNSSDDIEIITKNWDEIILEQVEQYFKSFKDKIMYILYNDDCGCHNTKKYMCWPFISKETFDTLGCLFPKELGRSSADIRLYEIFNELKNKKYDRFLNIGDSYKVIKHQEPLPNLEYRNLYKIRHLYTGYSQHLSTSIFNNYVNTLSNYITTKIN